MAIYTAQRNILMCRKSWNLLHIVCNSWLVDIHQVPISFFSHFQTADNAYGYLWMRTITTLIPYNAAFHPSWQKMTDQSCDIIIRVRAAKWYKNLLWQEKSILYWENTVLKHLSDTMSCENGFYFKPLLIQHKKIKWLTGCVIQLLHCGQQI